MRLALTALAAALLAVTPLPLSAQDGPAELPPAEYRGQQYVDSRGCIFLRAGQPGNEVWVPRVTRQGVPICGDAPSGERVAVAKEGAATSAAAGAAPAADPAGEGYFVAVGSFGVAANADNAEARLRALNYPVARGQLQGGSAGLITVFAGPFPGAGAAEEARQALRGQGFPEAMIVGP